MYVKLYMFIFFFLNKLILIELKKRIFGIMILKFFFYFF
jgi:hypothetical protein